MLAIKIKVYNTCGDPRTMFGYNNLACLLTQTSVSSLFYTHSENDNAMSV